MNLNWNQTVSWQASSEHGYQPDTFIVLALWRAIKASDLHSVKPTILINKLLACLSRPIFFGQPVAAL